MNAPVITHPRERLGQLREKLAEAAQRIIDALDYLDGDSDLEALGDEYEPSLATMDGRNHTIDFAGDTDDREDEHDGREEFLEGEDNEDREPEETDAWRVNPDSINQTGDRWLGGTATPDEFVRRDDPEPDVINMPGTFMREGVLWIGGKIDA